MKASRHSPQASGPEADERVRRVELLISNLLRTGVIASLTIILIGTILSFVHHPSYVTSSAELQRLTQAGAAFPYTWRDVLAGVQDLRGQAIVIVGLLMLIATPIARVAVSILAFIYQRDRVYTLITLAVLCLLLLSFVLGKVE
ncbi:MAG: DUF1634 domain-containing protein [Chloroflexota bacterium]